MKRLAVLTWMFAACSGSAATHAPSGPPRPVPSATLVLKAVASGDHSCRISVNRPDGSAQTLEADFALCPGGAHDATPLTGRRVQIETLTTYFPRGSCAAATVRGVSFVGNASRPGSELLEPISKDGGLWFTGPDQTGWAAALASAEARVLSDYDDHGRIRSQVSPARASRSRDGRHAYVTIVIAESPAFKIGRIVFDGDLLEPAVEQLREFESQPGQIFNMSRIENDFFHLRAKYQDQGYAFANLRPKPYVEIHRLLVDYAFAISKGPKISIDQIDIVGNTTTPDDVIRREIRPAVGALYSQTKLAESQHRLEQLGLFERVEVTSHRGAQKDTLGLRVRVVEKSSVPAANPAVAHAVCPTEAGALVVKLAPAL